MKHQKIARQIDKELEKDLKESLERYYANQPKPFAPKRLKVLPKCEQFGNPVYNKDDFLCSDRCANKYWNIGDTND